MKTKFLKLYVSAAVFVFAVMGAFATNLESSSKKTNATNIPGYVRNGDVCEVVALCSDQPGPNCTSPSNQQAFDYDSVENECIMPLSRAQ